MRQRKSLSYSVTEAFVLVGFLLLIELALLKTAQSDYTSEINQPYKRGTCRTVWILAEEGRCLFPENIDGSGWSTIVVESQIWLIVELL